MSALIAEKISLPEKYSLSPTAVQARDIIVAAARMVDKVSNPVEQKAAVLQGQILQGHIKEIKATRLAIARPLNEAADKLMQIERDYLAPVIAEKERLSQEVTSFQLQEEERVRREEAERRAEVERLEAERRAAEAKATRAKTEEAQLQAELVAHHASQAREELIRAPLPEPTKARGSATRRQLRHRVLDPKAVYASRPELCSLEVKASAVNALCNPPADATQFNPDTSIPGLETWWETVTSFRS